MCKSAALGQESSQPGAQHQGELPAQYLLCYAILCGVDGHQLRVLCVLVTTGRGSTVYHNLKKEQKEK